MKTIKSQSYYLLHALYLVSSLVLVGYFLKVVTDDFFCAYVILLFAQSVAHAFIHMAHTADKLSQP